MIRTTPLLLLAAALVLAGCSETRSRSETSGPAPEASAPAAVETPSEDAPAAPAGKEEKVSLTEEEWKERLTPEQYAICRGCGTEPAFSGKYWNTKTDGVYACVGCGQALFDSKTKYKSGSGWPSFWQPVDDEAVATREDREFGMVRVEILCSKCDSHLGHVFEDGPEPTGLRYCVNSGSLDLEPRDEPAK